MKKRQKKIFFEGGPPPPSEREKISVEVQPPAFIFEDPRGTEPSGGAGTTGGQENESGFPKEKKRLRRNQSPGD